MSDRRSDCRVATEEELKGIIKDTVRETLLTLGLDTADPIKLQRDFQHLREWREGTESIKSNGILTALGLLIAGALSALWIVIKSYLHIE